MTQTEQPKTGSGFTPGPWRVEEVGVEELFIVKPDGDGGWFGIAELSKDGAFADARLIAAAPEMYELLEMVEKYYHDAPDLHPHDWESIVNLSRRIKSEIDGEG